MSQKTVCWHHPILCFYGKAQNNKAKRPVTASANISQVMNFKTVRM